MGHIFAVSIRYTLMGQKDGGRLPLPLFFAMEGEMLMKIGYIRVSTVEQNTIRQETLMEALGVDEIYMDKVSGKNTNRPELQKMLHYVRKGDTVIVESISRFARNTKDLLELVEQLTAKEVEFISQKESLVILPLLSILRISPQDTLIFSGFSNGRCRASRAFCRISSVEA